jgi:hypothetical protein
MKSIKLGDKLIATSSCEMFDGSGGALIIGNEYEVISESENREEISVKSKLFDNHYFSTNSKDDSYWGIFFNLKSN